jgi:mRNA interferase MazF
MAMMRRGELWWANLAPNTNFNPTFERPILIVQDDTFNESRLNTVIVVGLTTNLELARARGNVLLSAEDDYGLKKDSVVNVTQLVTVTKRLLERRIGRLPDWLMDEVNFGLKLVLHLD